MKIKYLCNAKTIFLGFLLTIVLCINGNLSIAKSDNSIEILKKIEDRMNSIKTYTAIIKTYEYGKPSAETIKRFKAPNKFYEFSKIYINDKKSISSKKISDGSFIWTYTPFTKICKKEPIDTNSTPEKSSWLPLGTIDQQGANIKLLEETKICYIFEINTVKQYGKEKVNQKSYCYYRKDIGYPGKVIFFDAEGNQKTEMLLSYTNINKPINDSIFKFKVPINTKVATADEEGVSRSKYTVKVEGSRSLPMTILSKEEIIAITDKFAQDLGFDVSKCQKDIEKENGKWTVEYFNKSGRVSYKKIIFQLNEEGQYLGVARSPD